MERFKVMKGNGADRKSEPTVLERMRNEGVGAVEGNSDRGGEWTVLERMIEGEAQGDEGKRTR